MQTNKTWIIKNSIDDDNRTLIDEISSSLNISRTSSLLLLNRGCKSSADAISFIRKSDESLFDPFLLNDMEKAVDRINTAIEKKEKILIYGDYDVDGVTSVSCLMLYLRDKGADLSFHIPCRLNEGYGLSENVIKECKNNEVSLIITVDTGITAVKEVNIANELGIDVIITDHHECIDILPSAAAVINPMRKDETYPFRELAGVGVVYKLMCALEISSDRNNDVIGCIRRISGEYADLVALGTIADVMPVVSENRLIVTLGLRKIKNGERVSLAALINSTAEGLNTKSSNINITTSFIGFNIAPKLNAAGRIDDASVAVNLLISDSYSEAKKYADDLILINKKRQSIENDITSEAFEYIESNKLYDNSVIVLDDNNWHNGVIGIVASRITENYNVPSILVSFSSNEGEADGEDIGKGSGRSVKGINLVKALSECSSCLEKFGGHEMAAGLTLKRKDLETFKQKINEYVKSIDINSENYSYIEAECELASDDIDIKLCNEMTLLEPFGVSNPIPLFCSRDLTVSNIILLSNGKHIKFVLSKNNCVFTALYFRKNISELNVFINDKIEIVYSLEINEYQGIKSLQLIIKDLHLSDEISNFEKAEENDYLKIKNNNYKTDINDTEEYLRIIPTRNDFAVVYRFLESEINLGHKIFSMRALYNSLYKSVTPIKINLILDIFMELNLLSAETINVENRIYKFNKGNAKKVDLNNSAILKSIKKGSLINE